MADGEEQLQIDFDQPVHGIAPGQAVVCYEGDMVIEAVGSSDPSLPASRSIVHN